MFICLSIDEYWVVSTSWIVWIMLVWTFTNKFLYGHMFSIVFDMYLGVELPDHMVNLYLTFLRNCQTPFHSSVLLYIPTSILKGFQFLHILTHYCHCLTFIFCHPSGSSVVCHCGLGLMTNEWIWWLMTLSIFSRAFWPLVYLLGGGYSFARWKKFNRLFFCSFQFIEKLSRK